MGELWGRLLDNLKFLWPLRLIDADEQGVRFIGGKHVQHLMPGWYLHLPGWMKIESMVCTYQEVDCQVQSMDTKDNVPITFSANVGYVIHDYRNLRLVVQDYDGTLERSTRGILGELVESHNLADLRGARKSLAKKALKALTEETKDWGIEIQRVRLTDFAPRTKQLRLFGGGTLPING